MEKHHMVIQGECLSSIAKRYGFSDWRVIYEHPQNSDFRAKRDNPFILFPGDQIIIPEISLKEFDCVTERRHKFVLNTAKEVLRLVVIKQGKPLSLTDYEAKFAGRQENGTTDSDGRFEIEVPADVGTVKVKIANYLIDLSVGYLNPVGENTPDKGISGAQARLHNLGCGGTISGVLSRQTQSALNEFQSENELPESGNPDFRTLKKLEEKYGC